MSGDNDKTQSVLGHAGSRGFDDAECRGKMYVICFSLVVNSPSLIVNLNHQSMMVILI